ncbi:MAG: efflux RND transporter periplasmic adaptor subunit, partial [Clostridiales bacterium]|nr:efflux RND transporter periplasmic adaptor subunit [Clostridiales bacterium]
MADELIVSSGKKPNAFARHKKLYITLIVIAAVVVVYFVVLRPIAARTVQSVTPPETTTLAKQDLSQTVAATGYLQSVTSRTIAATSATSTYKVKEIYVSVGDNVTEGQPVCQLDTTDIDQQISNAEASISSSQAQDNLAYTQAEGARDQALLAATHPPAGTTSQQQQQLNDAYHNAQAQVDKLQLQNSSQQQQQQLQTLLQTKDDCTITSPISGAVTSINAMVGLSQNDQSSGSSSSSTSVGTSGLMVVQDLSQLEIPATIAEYDAVTLSPGLAVKITSDAIADKTWNGTIKTISPVATDTSGNFTATILLSDPANGLTPGMSTKMQIEVKSVKNAYAVPFDAVVTQEDGTKVVYALEGANGGTGTAGGQGQDTTGGQGQGAAGTGTAGGQGQGTTAGQGQGAATDQGA